MSGNSESLGAFTEEELEAACDAGVVHFDCDPDIDHDAVVANVVAAALTAVAPLIAARGRREALEEAAAAVEEMRQADFEESHRAFAEGALNAGSLMQTHAHKLGLVVKEIRALLAKDRPS